MIAKRGVLGPLAGLAAAAALLLAVDATLRLCARPTGYYAYAPRPIRNIRFIPDPILGYKPAPSQTVETEQVFDGHVLKAVYSIDRLGRRIVPGQHAGRRARPLLFFGCSFTFGQSVDDDQTLPYYVARLAPGFHVYNYGFMGWGPQNMLALLQKTDITAQIPEKSKAVGVYVLISDHVRRVAPTMSWARAGANLPYYAAGPSGRLEFKGVYGSARPLTAALYRLAAQSGFVRHFGLDWPPISGPDFEMTARIIAESRDAFKARFGSDEFYVVVFPSWPYDWKEKVATLLEKRGVRCLDYSEPDYSSINFGHPTTFADHHPVPEVYAAVAERIVHDLELARR